MEEWLSEYPKGDKRIKKSFRRTLEALISIIGNGEELQRHYQEAQAKKTEKKPGSPRKTHSTHSHKKNHARYEETGNGEPGRLTDSGKKRSKRRGEVGVRTDAELDSVVKRTKSKQSKGKGTEEEKTKGSDTEAEAEGLSYVPNGQEKHPGEEKLNVSNAGAEIEGLRSPKGTRSRDKYTQGEKLNKSDAEIEGLGSPKRTRSPKRNAKNKSTEGGGLSMSHAENKGLRSTNNKQVEHSEDNVATGSEGGCDSPNSKGTKSKQGKRPGGEKQKAGTEADADISSTIYQQLSEPHVACSRTPSPCPKDSFPSPKVLRPYLDIPAVNPYDFMTLTDVYDGRGGWKVFFTLTTAIIDKFQSSISSFLKEKGMGRIVAENRFHGKNVGYMEDLEGLATIMQHMFLCTTKGLTEEEIDTIAEEITVPPFWYKYGKGLSLLRTVIDMVKSAVSESITKGDPQTIDKDANPLHASMLNIVLHSTFYVFKGSLSENRQNKASLKVHSKASFKCLQTFFNLPDHPLCRTMLGITMPAIRHSKNITLPHHEDEKREVPCRLLYDKEIPFKTDRKKLSADSQSREESNLRKSVESTNLAPPNSPLRASDPTLPRFERVGRGFSRACESIVHSPVEISEKMSRSVPSKLRRSLVFGSSNDGYEKEKDDAEPLLESEVNPLRASGETYKERPSKKESFRVPLSSPSSKSLHYFQRKDKKPEKQDADFESRGRVLSQDESHPVSPVITMTSELIRPTSVSPRSGTSTPTHVISPSATPPPSLTPPVTATPPSETPPFATPSASPRYRRISNRGHERHRSDCSVDSPRRAKKDEEGKNGSSSFKIRECATRSASVPQFPGLEDGSPYSSPNASPLAERSSRKNIFNNSPKNPTTRDDNSGRRKILSFREKTITNKRHSSGSSEGKRRALERSSLNQSASVAETGPVVRPTGSQDDFEIGLRFSDPGKKKSGQDVGVDLETSEISELSKAHSERAATMSERSSLNSSSESVSTPLSQSLRGKRRSRRLSSTLPWVKSRSPMGIEKGSKNRTSVILHFHGGGFVAGSPQFHETYLRDWAIKTQALIISVDYTLSPGVKFPESLEECYSVYKWLVNENNDWNLNPAKIVLAGDSAGGNFALSVCYRAILDGIRIPDGILVLYPALNLLKSCHCSTSRVMFFHDTFVPIPFLFLCLWCYLPPVSSLCLRFFSLFRMWILQITFFLLFTPLMKC
eukprot:TRINITY_DN2872_c0_g1_i5.p1 TRINITY_DN2872_c0_g1~~TRINITY_DN2872_c0_g1_i5.p1  ORF type:complete len:1343 (-),score=247.31 TRINITY_DN2872_c0_g1_i5:882-4523(-)